MRLLFLYIISFFLFIFKVNGQFNLVKNYSFENINGCPISSNAVNDNMVSGRSPTIGTPDLFNVCGLSNIFSVPNNLYDTQLPRTGNGYAGIICYLYNPNSLLTEYREYIEFELLEPLKIGKKYCIKFFISSAKKPFISCNGIGVLFKNGTSNYNTYNNIPDIPQILNTSVISNSDWTEISSVYIADNTYDHIIIGNFYNNTMTTWISSQMPPVLWYTGYTMEDPMAYYYIDDVFVVEIENDCPENIDDSVNPIIPNIFTPNSDGFNDEFVLLNLFANSQLAIYNRWGTIVYQSNNYKNNWDGGNCTDGVYYYIVNTPNNKQYKGTVTILR